MDILRQLLTSGDACKNKIEMHTPVVPPKRDPYPLAPEFKLCSLPPFSPAAAKLIQMSATGNIDISNVKPVFNSDPSLAADVLRLANSPLFAVRNEVRSIEHAVVFLGLERVKSLAAAIAMRRFSAGSDHGAYRKCWEHSLACAVVCEELAESFSIRKEDAYTAGLLHDIGRVALLKAYSAEYLPVLHCQYERLDESLALERNVFTMDHCQSGSVLTKVWALPRSFQTVAETHHSSDNPAGAGMTNLVRVACLLTEALGFAEINYKNATEMPDALELLGGAVAKEFTARAPHIEQRAKDNIAYFSAA